MVHLCANPPPPPHPPQEEQSAGSARHLWVELPLPPPSTQRKYDPDARRIELLNAQEDRVRGRRWFDSGRCGRSCEKGSDMGPHV